MIVSHSSVDRVLELMNIVTSAGYHQVTRWQQLAKAGPKIAKLPALDNLTRLEIGD